MKSWRVSLQLGGTGTGFHIRFQNFAIFPIFSRDTSSLFLSEVQMCHAYCFTRQVNPRRYRFLLLLLPDEPGVCTSVLSLPTGLSVPVRVSHPPVLSGTTPAHLPCALVCAGPSESVFIMLPVTFAKLIDSNCSQLLGLRLLI